MLPLHHAPVKQSEWGESNSRFLVPKTSGLATCLHSDFFFIVKDAMAISTQRCAFCNLRKNSLSGEPFHNTFTNVELLIAI